MKKQTDTETLPITSARVIAFVAVAMSIGVTLIIYLFFLKDLFVGTTLLVVFAVMLALTLVSTLVALNNMLPKFRCPNCGQAFFHHVSRLFGKLGSCQHCHHVGKS